jgi:hypothetical protein
MRPIVNIAFLLIFSCLFTVSSAQPAYLSRKISVSGQQQSLKLTLSQIAEVGGFKFSYNTEIVPGDSLINYQFKDKSVEACLDDIFKGRIRYKASGDHIILLAGTDKNSKKVKYTISGNVVDAYTGLRMEDVSVYDVDEQYSTLTNANGYYKLLVPSDQPYRGLCYCKKGYVDTIIVVKSADRYNVNIKMNPAINVNPPKFVNVEPVIEDYPLSMVFIPHEVMVNADNLEKVSDIKLAQVSFLPALGTNLSSFGVVENRLSFNILAGYSKGVKGFEIGSLVNIVKENVTGVQLGGFGNMVGGKVRGAQISGFYNVNSKSIKGLQASGFANTSLDSLTGAQLTGFANILRGKMSGAQISGFYNMTTHNVTGLQLAGFANTTWLDVKLLQVAGFANIGRNVTGMQLSGFANVARGRVDGLQLAGFANFAQQVNVAQISGFMNIAYKVIKGIQFAPGLNIAGKVKGLQMGLVNYSDSTSGLSIGFLSIVRKGFHQLELSGNDRFFVEAAFKTGTKRFYNSFTGGFNAKNPEQFYIGCGFGSETQGKRRLYVGIDFTAAETFNGKVSFDTTFHNWMRVHPYIGIRLFKHSGISLGPVGHVVITNQTDETGAYSSNIPPSYARKQTFDQFLTAYWIGGRLAIRF